MHLPSFGTHLRNILLVLHIIARCLAVWANDIDTYNQKASQL